MITFRRAARILRGAREDDHTFVSHSGGCPGYYTDFRLEPKSKIAVIVLTNAIGSEVDLYTKKGYELIAPAIEQAMENPEGAPDRDPSLDAPVKSVEEKLEQDP